MARAPIATPSIAASEFAEQRLVERLRDVRQRVKEARRKPHSESIHKLRVGTRRAQAALDLFEPLLAAKQAQRVRKQLRKLRRTAGKARNLDVLAEHFQQREPPAPERLAKRVASDRDRAAAKLRRLAKRAFAEIGKKKQTQALLLRSERAESAAEFAAAALTPVLARFRQVAQPTDASAKNLHALRIAAKRLRYSLELLAGAVVESPRAELLNLLEEMQESLGKLNDFAAAAETIDRIAKRAKKAGERQWLAAQKRVEREGLAHAREAFLKFWSAARRKKFVQLAGALTKPTTKSKRPARPAKR